MSLLALFTVPVLFYAFFVTSPPKPTPPAKPTVKQVRAVYNKPTPTLTPTSTPTPSPTPKIAKKQIVIVKQEAVVSQDNKTYIMNAINDYRVTSGLSRVETDSNTCSFARLRAQEISQNFSHAGFRNRIDSKTLPYPSYKTVTENIARTSDYTKVVENWKNSSGHAENMKKDTPFVCVEQFGNFYAYEGLRL